MEVLEERWKSFHLTEDEDKEISIEDAKLEIGEKKGVPCLIGKIMVERKINKEVIHNTMKKAWKTRYQFDM